MATPGVNLRVLRKELAAQATRSIAPRAEKAMERGLDRIKNDLLKDFDNHPVTEELEGGSLADSNYVNTAHGGNLYSLLGFTRPEKPVRKLRRILEKSIKFVGPTKTKISGNKVIIEKTVESPSLETVANEAGAASKLAWTNRSWLDLLERGITGFASYLFDPDKFRPYSESGTAIEAKDKRGNLIKVRNGSMGPISYVSEILANLRNRIRGSRP